MAYDNTAAPVTVSCALGRRTKGAQVNCDSTTPRESAGCASAWISCASPQATKEGRVARASRRRRHAKPLLTASTSLLMCACGRKPGRFSRIAFIASATLLLLCAGSAGAQGIWFDIGSGQPATVFCPTDSASWIEFPPYPFGDLWPPGTLVYAALVQGEQESFATLYYVMFSDAGCGCGGYLYKPITYRFHYDQASVLWLEDSTTLFKLAATQWAAVGGASLDTEANVFLRSSQEALVGTSTYGIGPADVTTPTNATSWGRIKALYR